MLLSPKTNPATDDYVIFADAVREQLGQSQYASRYANGLFAPEYPDVVSGTAPTLRVIGRGDNYHEYLIHKDDVDVFIRRVKNCRNGR